MPFVVHVELTHRCNLRCRHCYLPSHGGAELDTYAWRGIFAELRRQGTLFVALSGGEPLCRADALDLCAAVRAEGMALRLLTNGTLLDDAMAARLAALAPAAVEVSLLGGTAAVHDAVSAVPGSFDGAVRALDRLTGLGVRTVVKVPVMRANWRDFAAIETIALARGAAVRYDVCISPRTDGDRTPLDERLQVDELAAFLEERSAGRSAVDVPVVPADAVPCGAGQNAFSLAPDGTVHPCTALRLPLGNVTVDGWDDIRRHPDLQRLRSLRFGALDTCGTCPHAALCGRCPGVALLETGRWDGPSPSACELGRMLAALLGTRCGS